LDDGGQEAEHTLFMTTARTKSAALNRLKTSNAYSKELLLQTPYSQILKRRKYWKEFAQQQKQFDRIEDSLGDGR
jgi:predicted chitinase